jgi:hypothetical protein
VNILKKNELKTAFNSRYYSFIDVDYDKLKMEKKILEKCVQRDENGNPIPAKDENGNSVEGAVNISNVEEFTNEMSQLMDVENEIPYEKINFEDLNLQTAKVKDLIKLEFLFN